MAFLYLSNRNSDKLEPPNKRILRFIILQDRESPYSQLSEKEGTISLFDKRTQNMLTVLFKCFHFGNYRVYLKRLFTLCAVNYSLRSTNILSLPKPLTTTYSLLSFKYYTAKLWNSFPDKTRTSISLTEFKRQLRQLKIFLMYILCVFYFTNLKDIFLFSFLFFLSKILANSYSKNSRLN